MNIAIASDISCPTNAFVMQYDLPPTFGIYLTPMIASFFTRSPLSTFFDYAGQPEHLQPLMATIRLNLFRNLAGLVESAIPECCPN
ncbi:hypothetical protein [Tunturiibacter lichenicola]|uniref:hypothetical protein n=1 Tax=Tunturiibacter lichenicola TaxID=2051959 RepID=UPI0021B16D29|nr:hypothetical protein [Edaphobacter lichenicola]